MCEQKRVSGRFKKRWLFSLAPCFSGVGHRADGFLTVSTVSSLTHLTSPTSPTANNPFLQSLSVTYFNVTGNLR